MGSLKSPQAVRAGVQAVGFDLDYTLAVPVRDRERLFRDALEAVDGPAISREEYRRAHREDIATETREPIFASLLEDYDDDTDPAALTAAYGERILDALVPIPGADDLLDRLGQEYRIGLLTDGPVRAQHGKLEVLGWTDRFDAVVITGTLPAGKPDRRAFRALLDELDTPPDRTAYVGDDPVADVVGAKEAGLRAIQVVDGTASDGPGRDPDADPDPHPLADAVVARSELATVLPDVLEGLDR